ncbi:MAG: hypothetical protein LBD18_05870 [Treponema sp.]|jgi:hypothetical protein|nr:hypothetical protein [Treponema sp.]
MSSPGGHSVYDESAAYAFFKTLAVPSLRGVTIRCIAAIFGNFFFRQYRAALLPGRVPVTRVDHPLDLKIPFIPGWVTIYLDFTSFWTRMLSFLLHTYKRKAFTDVREFIKSMGELYKFAAEVYQNNFSTTDRPFYIARPRFFLIHLLDPHLMCIPSLHVMVVIRTWTRFAAIIRSMGDAERFAPQIEEMKQGALAITQAILFVKQHSVNCIAAAFYAMTCYDPELFPSSQAEAFAAMLFNSPPDGKSSARVKQANAKARPSASPRIRLSHTEAEEIKTHIVNLYRHFLAERTDSMPWREPLLNFLRPLPRQY